jgi:hypothetical protein
MLPPGLLPQAANLGATGPSGNAGTAAEGMLKVRAAVKLLESALPMIPMGSPLHDKILSATKGLLDALPDEDPSMAGPQQTNLLELIRSAAQNAPTAMLSRLAPPPAGPALPAPAPALAPAPAAGALPEAV